MLHEKKRPEVLKKNKDTRTNWKKSEFNSGERMKAIGSRMLWQSQLIALATFIRNERRTVKKWKEMTIFKSIFKGMHQLRPDLENLYLLGDGDN